MTDARRRQLMIDRPFQFALIAKLVVLQLVLLAVATGAIWVFADSELGTTLQRAHTTVASVRELLLPVVLTMAVVNAALAAGATVWVVLVASHRIAGPLYRVRTALSEFADGALAPHARIREHDQAEPLADQVQETIARIAGDVEAAQGGLAAAVAACEAGGVAVPESARAASRALARYTRG